MLHKIEKNEKEYKIVTKEMKIGEKAICKEDDLEVQKQSENSYILMTSKSNLKKIR